MSNRYEGIRLFALLGSAVDFRVETWNCSCRRNPARGWTLKTSRSIALVKSAAEGYPAFRIRLSPDNYDEHRRKDYGPVITTLRGPRTSSAPTLQSKKWRPPTDHRRKMWRTGWSMSKTRSPKFLVACSGAKLVSRLRRDIDDRKPTIEDLRGR